MQLLVLRIIRRGQIALYIYCTEAFLLAHVARNLKKKVYKSEFQYFAPCDVITPRGVENDVTTPAGGEILTFILVDQFF